MTDSGRGTATSSTRSTVAPVGGLAFGVVEEAVDDALDLVLELGDAAGGEGLVDEAAQAGVVGVVLVDHALGEQAEHLGQVAHEEADDVPGSSVGLAVGSLEKRTSLWRSRTCSWRVSMYPAPPSICLE